MTTEEKAFLDELESLRRDSEGCIQYWYTLSSIRLAAHKHQGVKTRLDNDWLFWNTVSSSLQVSTFIAMGRVFDQNSPHNIDRLIGNAQRNIKIFSREALERRKIEGSPNAPEWIDEYMLSTYEPCQEDFRKLRKHIKRYRAIYESNYRDIRHKVYAHKEVIDDHEVAQLFAVTNIKEMQKMMIFLKRIHECLWQLFYNGRKPVLRPMRHSVENIFKQAESNYHGSTIQERITLSTKNVLLALASQNA